MPAFGGQLSRREVVSKMNDLIGMLGVNGQVGNIWFVNSVTGVDGAGYGGKPSRPLATVEYAISLATANNNDVIACMPGHTQDVGPSGGDSPFVVSKAGLKIVGIGTGTNRPTLTCASVTGVISMTAANCSLEGFLVQVTDDATVVVDIKATDCAVRNCEFRHGSSKEWVTCINVVGDGPNDCDRTVIEDCEFLSIVAGSNQCIELGDVHDRVRISRCRFFGDWANAAIHNPTGFVLTRLVIEDCLIENTQTGDHSIELVSACTGMLVRNMYKNDMTQATGVDPGSCFSFQCFHCDTIDVSAILCPAAT